MSPKKFSSKLTPTVDGLTSVTLKTLKYKLYKRYKIHNDNKIVLTTNEVQLSTSRRAIVVLTNGF